MSDLAGSVFEYLEWKAIEMGRELTDTEVITCKKEYRKAYLKAYKKKYRRSHRQLSVSLTPKEYQQFLEKAQESGKKTRAYIKEALLSNGNVRTTPKIFESILHVIDLIDEGLFESNLKRIKEALVHLNSLKNELL